MKVFFRNFFSGWMITALFFFPADQASGLPDEGGNSQDAEKPFSINAIGPETLLPLDRRGIIRLVWNPYERRSRFEFKHVERPIYRVYISPEGFPASSGRICVTYGTSYPFTNLVAGEKYKIMVDVEQNGRVVLAERLYEAGHVAGMVKWFAAPRAEGGSPDNPGTYSKPVDVSFVNANAGAGDVVVFKSGVYFRPANGAGDSSHDRAVHPQKSGSPGAHILFLAESNDVSMKRQVSFRTAWGNIYVNKTDHVVFDGLNCDDDQGLNSKALTSVLGEYGHRPTNIIIRNIYYRAMTSDKQLMVNASREVLIENCFFSGSTESHNAYLCNNTYNRTEYAESRIIFRNSISMNSARNNVHANGFFDNFIIENNIFVGAKVANISLATVHRNSHVRNNIAYGGAKQALTLNFYQEQPGFPLEDREPSSNIQICHNTFVVPETTRYSFADIIISDSRRRPHRHVVEGLHIKNNILVSRNRSDSGVILNLMQSRHLGRMEVCGNVYFKNGELGGVLLPTRSSNENGAFSFDLFEKHWKEKKVFESLDRYRDEQGNKAFEKHTTLLERWTQNRQATELGSLFVDVEKRDFRISRESPAAGAGVYDNETCRITRDIYGNPRHGSDSERDAGAVVSEAGRGMAPELSEYRLFPSAATPFDVLILGKRTLVCAARLDVRSSSLTSLKRLVVEFVIEKTNKDLVVNVNDHFKAEVELGGESRTLDFYRGDKEGNENVWLSGYANGLNLFAADGESLDVKVYLTLDDPGKIDRVSAVIAHDNVWGFDGSGRKLAVTGFNEILFKQEVR